ncbi:MAG TPA: 4-(cytidine 5'-diphospho)-2-C-methyl-D-erythritol kinase [Burkholderiales bacterium]|nr:4-(cytidine 5'-diphospho)-2-C-methyl-D-erythritol kinase [Burkholderiales bacterium]
MEITWYPAPGKLNLFLHVLARRPDGYHELQTAFRLIDRADRVGITLREDGAVAFSGVFGEDNLCLRAARLLQREAGCRLGADLRLEKALPVGGGLGGGSSDAATVLLVLNRLWKSGLDRKALADLALRLGADVPFFLYGRNALGEGVGERLTPLALAPAWYLVLVPQVSVSTKETFASALTRRSKRMKIPPFFPGQGSNDLEAAVVERHPEVGAHLAWLRQRCPQARMTGSGACVFAEFESRAQADAVQSQLPEGMNGFVTHGLDRHPLYDWTD